MSQSHDDPPHLEWLPARRDPLKPRGLATWTRGPSRDGVRRRLRPGEAL